MAKPAGEGTRSVTALIGGFDALVVSLGSIALLVAGTSLSWWLDAGATGVWLDTFRSAINIWFAANGVALQFAASTYYGLDIPAFNFWSLPLGAVLVFFGLGYRAGLRLYGAKELWPGWVTSIAVYAGVSSLAYSVSGTEGITANATAVYVLPTLIYMSGVFGASLFGGVPHQAKEFVVASERAAGKEWVAGLADKVGWVLASIGSPALRAATGFVFALQALSAVVFAVLLGWNWLNVIQLYEQLQGGIFGGLGSTILQIGYLPNIIFYVSTWLVGPGFAIGAGSSISPLGTAVGPMPTIPLFGTIPAADFQIGMLVLVVPVIIAIAVNVAVKRHAADARHHFATPLAAAIAMGVAVGVIAAAEMALLAMLTHASIGPMRMQLVGADPIWVFVWTLLEVAPVAFLTAFYAVKPTAPAPIPEHLKR